MRARRSQVFLNDLLFIIIYYIVVGLIYVSGITNYFISNLPTYTVNLIQVIWIAVFIFPIIYLLDKSGVVSIFGIGVGDILWVVLFYVIAINLWFVSGLSTFVSDYFASYNLGFISIIINIFVILGPLAWLIIKWTVGKYMMSRGMI